MHSIHIECTINIYTILIFFLFLLVAVLDDNKLNPKQGIGLSSDGEEKMKGIHNGWQAKLRQMYPWMVYIKCTPHTTDLCSKASIKVLPSDVIKIVTESYNWFAHSIKRQTEYKEILELVGFALIDAILHDDEDFVDENGTRPPLRLISTSITRWLAIADCIERLLQQVIILLYYVQFLYNLVHSSRDECTKKRISYFFLYLFF